MGKADGKGSHWSRVDTTLRAEAGIDSNEALMVAADSSKDWSEPEMPAVRTSELVSDLPMYTLWL